MNALTTMYLGLVGCVVPPITQPTLYGMTNGTIHDSLPFTYVMNMSIDVLYSLNGMPNEAHLPITYRQFESLNGTIRLGEYPMETWTMPLGALA